MVAVPVQADDPCEPVVVGIDDEPPFVGFGVREECLQPTHLDGTYDAATGAVVLTWQAPGSGEWTYELYRDGTFLAVPTALSYTDTTASAAANHYTLFAHRTNGPVSISSVIIGCEPVVLQIDYDPPYLRPGIRDECLET